MEPCAPSDSDLDREAAVTLLCTLAAVYAATRDDVVELSLDSGGKAGAFVYPQSGGSLRQLGRVLDLSGLDAADRAVLEALWRRIPSRRCGVRALVGGGLSLFWPIDLDAVAISCLTTALDFSAASAQAGRFVCAVGRPACGIAYERAPGHAARWRIYHMAHGAVELQAALAAAVRYVGVRAADADWLGGWAAPARGGGFAAPVVVNLAFDSGGSRSIKLELPGVPVAPVPAERGLDAAAAEVWRTAAAWAACARCDRFNYLGVRCDARGRRGLTTYMDGQAWISARGEEAAA
ncbi:MAG TPA: hypothetical protein VFX80_04470 [Solirubrobacteraceae bacterium]|nr:hypothetical protein [Solirubrobacteraceae bacterium]